MAKSVSSDVNGENASQFPEDGLFFVFDGIDGAGKSTQTALFADWLSGRGYDVRTCRDPGTTALGERLRDLVLTSGELHISAWSETLVYMAARAQLVAEVVVPALRRGSIVVSDRFLLANVVYQGHGLDLGADNVWRLGRFATQGLQPTHTFVLDLDVDAAVRRLGRETDRMEQRGSDYLGRVRDGFRAEANRDPERTTIIPADQPVEVVQEEIRSLAARWLEI